MSDFAIQSVLSQIRALSAQAAGKPAAAAAAGGPGFVGSLRDAVEQVSKTQQNAQQAARDFELGRVDLPTAVLAAQESQVAFKATVEVRNRMVRAYQDIMNMPI